jgi:hypothetical protein
MNTVTYTSDFDATGNRYWLAATYSNQGDLVDLSPVMSKCRDYKIPTGSTIIAEVPKGKSSRAINAVYKDLAPLLVRPKEAPFALKEFTDADYKNGLGGNSGSYMDRAATSYAYAIDLDAPQNNGGRMSTVVQIAIYRIGTKSAAAIWLTLPNGETVLAIGPKRLYTNDAVIATATLFLADPGYNPELDSLSRPETIALTLARAVNPNGRYATI